MNKKLKETRIVVFEEDYNPTAGKGKRGRLLYEAGKQYAIHFKVVELLKARGVKLKATSLTDEVVEQKIEKIKKSTKKK